MDKRKKTVDVIKALHSFQSNEITEPDFIKIVADYFDYVKESELSESDLKFLTQISNVSGIPHYFDHLGLFQNRELSINDFSLSTLSAQIYESTLYTSDTTKVHKYQKRILSKFNIGEANRYFLSASTSFGKTHVVYEIMKKMKYKNVVLIFPTIALLTENLEKLHLDDSYKSYNIHTLSDVELEDVNQGNIFIYTPERFLSFLEKQDICPSFDFVFIDEVYKIDNEYIIDEDEKKENERDVSYRIAAYYSVLGSADILFAGPYIEEYSSSFELFLNRNDIKKLDFNKYEIVGKSYHEIKTAKTVKLNDDLTFKFSKGENGKEARLRNIVITLLTRNKNEGCIVYCSSPSSAEKYAKCLPKLIEYNHASNDYKTFVNHVEKEYGSDWIVVVCLKIGIGVHHGLIPKYIQKEIISFFNLGIIKVLTSTTTITEGVNTSAKNLIVTNNKKGNKSLKRFDAKNIAGRAGRFDKHYSGRVIILKNKFLNDLNTKKESINHKNYDLNAEKQEIDLFYSNNEFLTNGDKLRKENILLEQERRQIPSKILDMFKVVSRADKIKLYDSISDLNEAQFSQIRMLIRKINNPMYISIDWDGMQIILQCIVPIVNSNLRGLIERKTNNGEGEHSIIIPILNNYLEKGFKGLVSYKRKSQGETTDQATRSTARFVFNTAKYQLVKYFGVFNVMYKFHRSNIENVEFEDVAGIDKLLTKLEYNALTELGRKVSDFGVPDKVLRYYENDQSVNIINTFDDFELKAFNKVKVLVER